MLTVLGFCHNLIFSQPILVVVLVDSGVQVPRNLHLNVVGKRTALHRDILQFKDALCTDSLVKLLSIRSSRVVWMSIYGHVI